MIIRDERVVVFEIGIYDGRRRREYFRYVWIIFWIFVVNDDDVIFERFGVCC